MLDKIVKNLVKMGVKTADEATPEMVQKATRLAQMESNDAVVKLGSGKNLEALQQAKIDAPNMDAPAYPKNIAQEEGNVNFTMPKEEPSFTMPAQGETSLVPHQKAGLPQAPKVLPDIETTATNIPQSTDLVTTMNGQMNNVMKPNNKLRNTALATGATVAGIGALNMAGNDQAPAKAMDPVTAAMLMSSAPSIIEAIRKPADVVSSAPNPQAPVAAPEVAPVAEANTEDQYMKMMKEAQHADKMQLNFNNIAAAGDRIGHGLARVTLDEGANKARREENKGRNVDNVKGLMTADMDSKKLKKEQTALNDEKRLRDPKSDASKAFHNIMDRLGVPYNKETTSAWDAKALGINPQNFLMQERSLDMQEKLLDKKSRKDTESFITGAQKTLLKPYQSYQKVATAKKALDGYLSGSTSGAKDVAILYNFIKGLDPDSAVKEGEIELGKSAMSLLEQYGIKAKKLTNGDVLSPKFRAAIGDILKGQEQQARSNYEEISRPFIAQGASRGLEEADYGKFDYMSAANAHNKKESPTGVVKETKDIGGVKYEKVDGGWKKVK